MEWGNLERLASAAHSPLTAGKSPSALWLWYEDPTASSLCCAYLEMERGSQPRTWEARLESMASF